MPDTVLVIVSRILASLLKTIRFGSHGALALNSGTICTINTRKHRHCVFSQSTIGDPKLLGPSSGQGIGGRAQTRDRSVSADLRAASLSTEPPTPPKTTRNAIRSGDVISACKQTTVASVQGAAPTPPASPLAQQNMDSNLVRDSTSPGLCLRGNAARRRFQATSSGVRATLKRRLILRVSHKRRWLGKVDPPTNSVIGSTRARVGRKVCLFRRNCQVNITAWVN
ncbi:hypothetical protein PoB_005641900 [Plakobranchus ocellatus]|uniref:Uncharacterized protein n=1 Tax=Plakobranchus ocellatus TaxID=259542 RepID=A0AAV4CBG0_9GAST|nr:hypothetical protein PoB_005641900 [Plakobranchus ocellatus]